MQFLEVKDRIDWEIFQEAQPWNQFTQSWAWGEFRRSLGFDVSRFALLDDEQKIVCAMQGEFRKKKFGLGYWFAPRGPVFHKDTEQKDYRPLVAELAQNIYQRGDLSRCLFLRMEPLIKSKSFERPLPPRFCRVTPVNPACTRLIDLYKNEEELLAEMHPKTRYNIKVAQKHGVTVRTTSHPTDLDKFLRLMDETAARDKFVQHQGSYLAKTHNALAGAGMARLRVAEVNGAMLAANLEIIYGNTVTYLYGASSHLMRQAMAPYILQWEAIRAAKAQGKHWYDLWGENPERASSVMYKKSWGGISRFKAGWGGEHIELLGTWDLPINYWLYQAVFFKRMLKQS